MSCLTILSRCNIYFANFRLVYQATLSSCRCFTTVDWWWTSQPSVWENSPHSCFMLLMLESHSAVCTNTLRRPVRLQSQAKPPKIKWSGKDMELFCFSKMSWRVQDFSLNPGIKKVLIYIWKMMGLLFHAPDNILWKMPKMVKKILSMSELFH